MSFNYEFPRPALAVDVVVFGYRGLENPGEGLSLLLVKRGIEPFKDRWALPGGFVQMNETLDEAAMRELKEESGLKNVFLEQLYTFGEVERDPRERVISVSYFALVQPSKFELKATTDAIDAKWFPMEKRPKLAFDHAEIIEVAVQRLRNKIRYEPIGFELLPRKFTLTQIQSLYETILDQKLDKRNFRRKISSYGILKELDDKVENVPYRAPSLFAFDEGKYRALVKSGYKYEI
ncbi:MAG: NUDIX domain-containing protein [Bdellovibrionota bacterium]